MERILKSKLKNGAFDGLTPEHSRRMSAVRSTKNKTTESALRMALVRAGVKGWILHHKIPGNPDFYFPHEMVAVFVDGCFWHGCKKCGHIPNRNRAYWTAKLDRNQKRDKQINRHLKRHGVVVLRFWEHELKNNCQSCLEKIQSASGLLA
jgi:DNA mismatch endonuclease Vsr